MKRAKGTQMKEIVHSLTLTPDIQFKTLAMHLQITSSDAVVIDHSEINIIKHK